MMTLGEHLHLTCTNKYTAMHVVWM